jgi:subtilisin-like proprotein convertase family protein
MTFLGFPFGDPISIAASGAINEEPMSRTVRRTRRIHLAAHTIALLALALSVTPAAEHLRPEGRFDDRIRHLEGGPIVVETREFDRLASSDSLKSRWQEFSDRNGGGWKGYVDERTGMPTLAAGGGVVWFTAEELPTVDLETAAARARLFLAESDALLGDWKRVLELDRDASYQSRSGHWQLVFRQVVDGVRVENARLTFHLKHGRLMMFGAQHWGAIATDGAFSIDADEARATLDAYLGSATAGFEEVTEPQLTLRAIDATPTEGRAQAWAGPRGEGLEHVLLWRFRFREPGAPAVWVGEVDAHDGSVRAFYDGASYGSVRGGVFPVSSDGDCGEGGCEIVGFPMPYADYTETGEPEAFADPFGNLVCTEETAGFETNLAGPYVVINDTCGPTVETGTCEDGVDLGLKHGENCAVGTGQSAGNTPAARNAYYHINRVMETARFYDDVSGWLSQPLTVNVNIDNYCNANWDMGEVNMFGAGGNCSNTGENPGTLIHEWAHGYDFNDGGGMDSPGEGYADIVSMLVFRDSCQMRGWYNDGSTCANCIDCTGVREHDWEKMTSPGEPAGRENWVWSCSFDPSEYGGPCRTQPHCESQITSETFYDLATRDLPAAGMDQDSAWQLVERLWFTTRPGSGGDAYYCSVQESHSCGADTWYQQLRAADDDDGNLANGTPHAAAIFAAFDRHELACGTATDPENQSTSSCPALAAPVVSATETASGTELSWNAVAGAAEYRVYRGEIGCDRMQVPIGSLTGGQTSYLDTVADQEIARFYRVQVFGSNPACSSPVSTCEATSLNTRIQKSGHRVEDGGNGVPEPGETVQLPIALYNTGAEGAMSVGGAMQWVGPGAVRVLEPASSWTTIPPGGVLESDAHFEVALFEDATCGDLLTFDYQAAGSNTNQASGRIEIPMGDPSRSFHDDQSVPIPPEAGPPVTSTLAIDQNQTVSDVEVTVRIRHDDATQMIVELTSPDGTTVRLHDRSTGIPWGSEAHYGPENPPDGPGSLADFTGETTLGDWTLSIQDMDSSGPTSDAWLLYWTLHLGVTGGFDCNVQTCPEPTPTEAPDLSVVRAGDDLVLSWNPIAGAAGHHVMQSAMPVFDAGAVMLDRTTAETSHTISGGVGATPDVTFFQVRATNSCNQEGP